MLVDLFDFVDSDPASYGCGADCLTFNARYQLDYADPADPASLLHFPPAVLFDANCACYFLDIGNFCLGGITTAFLQVCCFLLDGQNTWSAVFSLGRGVDVRVMTWDSGDFPATGDCIADLDGVVLQGFSSNDAWCRSAGGAWPNNAKPIMYPCGGFVNCCGAVPPRANVSTGVATIAGVGGCSGNPLHPTNGAHPLTYRLTGAYNPCGAANFAAGSMKWIADVGNYILLATCRDDHIDLVYWYYTCNLGGSLGRSILWYGTAPLGSCSFDGVVLALNVDLFGCADPASTVTLSGFTL